MGKVYAQHTGSAWDFSGSISKSSSANSGSFLTRGYNRLVGAIYTSGSLTSGSGLHIWQSIDDGTNWDIVHNYAPSTVGTSSYDIEVVGERMFISASPGEDNITAFRSLFYLQPIGLGTVGLKVGSIDIGNVIVDDIANIQNRVSASISSGSITVLSPAGSNLHTVLESSTSDVGLVHVGTGASVIGYVNLASGASDFGIVHAGTGTCDIGIVHVGTGASVIGVVQSPAGSDLHAVLETSTSTIGNVGIATKTLTYVSGSTNISGSNLLAGSPTAGSSIYVSSFSFQNEAALPLTMILQAGVNEKWRYFGQNQGNGLALAFSFGREWMLGSGSNLVLWLSASLQCGYSIAYFIDTV